MGQTFLSALADARRQECPRHIIGRGSTRRSAQGTANTAKPSVPVPIRWFGYSAQRTPCASGFDCADPDALSTAGPGPRR